MFVISVEYIILKDKSTALLNSIMSKVVYVFRSGTEYNIYKKSEN